MLKRIISPLEIVLKLSLPKFLRIYSNSVPSKRINDIKNIIDIIRKYTHTFLSKGPKKIVIKSDIIIYIKFLIQIYNILFKQLK